MTSGSRERGELFLWDPKQGERVTSFNEHPAIVYGISWGQSQEILISGDGTGILQRCNLSTGKCILVCEAHKGGVKALKRNLNGELLASCGEDGLIVLWDLETRIFQRTLRRNRLYERLSITGIKGLSEAQKESLRALGAVESY